VRLADEHPEPFLLKVSMSASKCTTKRRFKMYHLCCDFYTLLFGSFASFFCIFCFAVFLIVTCCFCLAVLQAVAFAGDVYYLGMMQESVEDGCGGGYVADQFAPLLQWPI